MFELELDQPSIVYRGTQITTEKVHILEENEGCLIASNGFLFTSCSRDVAKIFTGSAHRIQKHVEPMNYMLMSRTIKYFGMTLASYKHNDENNDREAFDCFQRAIDMYNANGLAQSLDILDILYQQEHEFK
ncbi:hypothetical protein I4U23_015978 [Adineta vaga]|nr:hypothetical protein I4U23_015978 [Adineta vaga]